jgi:hypothetical protein
VAHKRRRLERRGSPRKAVAKRRATTTAGRAPEVDQGTTELRRRKRRATSREDLEVNGAAVLFGYDHLDRAQYDTLGVVTELLQRVARAWGGRDGNVVGLWMSITGALVATGYAPAPAGVGGFSLADSARRRLARLVRELDGSRDLVIALAEGRVPPLVVHILEGRISDEDEVGLARLREGLDRIGRRGGSRRSA